MGNWEQQREPSFVVVILFPTDHVNAIWRERGKRLKQKGDRGERNSVDRLGRIIPISVFHEWFYLRQKMVGYLFDWGLFFTTLKNTSRTKYLEIGRYQNLAISTADNRKIENTGDLLGQTRAYFGRIFMFFGYQFGFCLWQMQRDRLTNQYFHVIELLVQMLNWIQRKLIE